MTTPTVAALAARGLRLERGERLLLDDFDFDAAPGEVVHLSGRNGSGKTTLLRALAGLVRPDAGAVTWHGAAVGGNPAFQRELVYVGHLPALNGDLDGRENLRFLAALLGSGRSTDLEQALARLDARGYADRPVRLLSAGQRQRLSLARLVLLQGSLWLLDEPFTALDQVTRGQVEALVEAHAAAGGITVIATHQAFSLGCPVRLVALGRGTT